MDELWRESWEVNLLVNCYITENPTAVNPGFDVSRHE